MSDEYITDPALLEKLNSQSVTSPEIQVTSEGYISDPKLLKKLGTVQSAVEQNAPPSFIEDIIAPQPRRPFQAGNIIPDVLIGAGIGSVFPGVGTIGGGIAGAASGLTGEFLRSMGRSKAEVFTGELLGGFAEGAVKKLGSKAISLIDYKTGKAADLMKKVSSDEERAILNAKTKVFGPSTFEGLYTTKNSDALQNTLKGQLNELGVVVDEGKKASDIIRTNLYKDMSNSRPFVKSTEYAELGDEIAALRARNLISPKEEANLEKILKNQLNTNPKIAATAQQDIINLIQNGGTYTVEGETKAMISPDAQKVLRKYFDNYLETYTGSKGYKILKDIEQQEYIAAARDSIPTLVDSQFKKIDKPFMAALENIAQSPEAKNEFISAINQHFLKLGNLTTKGGKEFGTEATLDGLKKEFNRLRPALEETGVFTRDQIIDLRQKLYTLPKEVSKEKIKQIFIDPLMSAAVGAVSSETTRGARSIYSSVMPM